MRKLLALFCFLLCLPVSVHADITTVPAGDGSTVTTGTVRGVMNTNFSYLGNQGATKWASGRAYTADNNMVMHDGNLFTCTSSHTAASATEPGTGADWATVWDFTGRANGITPEMFGATGDGTTNDATELQEALTYAQSNGLSFLLTPGKTYVVNSEITTGGSVTIIGRGATLKAGAAIDSVLNHNTTGELNISGLKIDGDNLAVAGFENSGGITQGSVINGVWIWDCTTYGWLVNNFFYNLHIDQMRISGGEYGIYSSSTSTRTNGARFTNFRVSNTTTYAVCLSHNGASRASVAFANPTIEGNSGGGFYIKNTYALLDMPYFESNGSVTGDPDISLESAYTVTTMVRASMTIWGPASAAQEKTINTSTDYVRVVFNSAYCRFADLNATSASYMIDAGNFTVGSRVYIEGIDLPTVEDYVSTNILQIPGTDDQTSSEVNTDTTNFDNNLSAANTTVQSALETLDELTVSGSALTTVDESTTLSTATTKYTFTGTGVTATEPGAEGEITVTIAGGAAPVDSVNGETGVVVLDASDFSILDVGGLITATDIDGALTENRTAIDALESAGYMTEAAIEAATLVFTNNISAPGFVSTTADGGHYSDVVNTVSITATATEGFMAYYNGRMRLADGTDWDGYFLEDTDIASFEPADAAITKTDEAETITANWVNTANPWAANEITEADPNVDTSSEIVTIINTTPSTLIAEGAIHGDIARDTELESAKFTSLQVFDLDDSTTPSVLTADETTNKVISNYKSTGADHVFTLPTAHENGNVIFQIGDEYQVSLDPPSGTTFYLNGTVMASDENIINDDDTILERIVCYCPNVNGSLVWACYSSDANWTEATP